MSASHLHIFILFCDLFMKIIVIPNCLYPQSGPDLRHSRHVPMLARPGGGGQTQ